MTIGQKTVNGIIWTGLGKMSMQAMLFILTVILARLLTPDDFGIVGMAAIITVAISVINERGLGTAVVQRRNIDPSYFSSVFWGSIAFGIILFLLSAAAAYPISLFYKNARVGSIITVQALGFIIGAFGIVQKSLLTREMAFKKLSIIDVISVIISAGVAISMALLGFGVWSLVFGMLIRDLINVTLACFVCDWHPQWHFSWREFKELFVFSSKVLGNDVALYLNTNADIVIIGRILGASALGFYSIALYLVKLPITRISGIVSKVTFPAFSILQNDMNAFKRAYAKAITYISIVAFPMLTGMALFANELVLVFFGEKWLQMVTPLIILAPMAILKSVGTIKNAVLLARGKPEIELWWNVVYLIPLATVIYIGTRFGLMGVSAAFTALYLITFPIIQGITIRQVKMSWPEFIKAVAPALISSAAMLGFGVFIRVIFRFITIANPWFVLITGVMLTAAFYVLVLRVFFNNLIQDVILTLKRTLSRKYMLENVKIADVEVPAKI